jgi:hypothetical protein
VSYRRGDSGHAGRLYDALSSRFGANNVFMDIDTIDPGVDFAEVINRAVTSCDVVIALIGRSWIAANDPQGRRRLEEPDDFVRLELESALAKDIVVIPACVQGAQIPSGQELPPSIAPLARRQAIDLRDVGWHEDVGRLIRRLERLEAGGTEEVAAAPVPSRRLTKRMLIPVGLAVAALAVAGVFLLRGSGDDGSTGTGAHLDRLREAIPSVTRPSCRSIPWGEESALGSLECSGARLAVSYHQFADNEGMQGWYIQSRELAKIEPDTGSCTGIAFRGERDYSVGGLKVGRYYCFVDTDGETKLVWTDERLSVGSESNVYEGTGRAAAESMLRQWRCCLVLQG